MKKTLSLILALVMCLSLCACGSGTKLTLDNYTDYMKVSAWVAYTDTFRGDDIWFGKINPSSGYKRVLNTFSTTLSGRITTKNVATNFNYENVKITVRFTGTVFIVDKDSGTSDIAETYEFPFEFEHTFGLTMAGDAKDDRAKYELPLPDNMVAIFDDYKEHGTAFEIKYETEIVAVSGTVNRA